MYNFEEYESGNRTGAVRSGRWKIINARGGDGDDSFELYDLEADPGEEVDVSRDGRRKKYTYGQIWQL